MTVGATLLIAAVQQATLTGVVRDSVDLEPVAFAQFTVASVDGKTATLSVASDRFGAFVVPGVLAGRPLRVEVSAFGYAVWARTYEAAPSNAVQVVLTPAPISLEGLDVTAGVRAGDPLSLSRDGFVIDSMLIRSLGLHLGPVHPGRHQRRHPGTSGRCAAVQRVPLRRVRLGDQPGSGETRDGGCGIGRRRTRHRVALGCHRHRNPGWFPGPEANDRLSGAGVLAVVRRRTGQRERELPGRRTTHVYRRFHIGAQEAGGH